MDMKLVLMTAVMAFATTLSLIADTETVGGYTWTYRVTGESVEIYNNEKAAVSPRPTGALTIPSMLGGKPVTSVGRHSFHSCTNITNVEVGSSVTNVDPFAFSSSLSNITSFTVSEQNLNYATENGLLLSKDGETLIQGVNGVVTVPRSVKYIGDCAFYGRAGLTSVTFPDGVANIGEESFSGCNGLVNVVIPDCLTNIQLMAFWGCSGLTNVTIGCGVNTIELGAFEWCSRLTNLNIPDSVVSIGDHAFENCGELVTVNIGKGLENIGSSVFAGCSNLMSFVVVDDNPYFESSSGILIGKSGWRKGQLVSGVNGDVVIPNGVRNIAFEAFSGYTRLTSVIMPNSLTTIYGDAFSDCVGLTSVRIPNGVTLIESGAFAGCHSLTNLVLGSGVESIKWAAFSKCSGLLEIIIPDNVKYIHSYAFNDCSSVTNVIVGNGLLEVNYGAFSGCSAIRSATISSVCAIEKLASSSIQSITLPEDLSYIGSDMFSGCRSLTRLTIPDSVTRVGYRAFEGCTNLIDETTFPGLLVVDGWVVGNNGKLSGALDLNGLRGIADGAFSKCVHLSCVELPDDIAEIGSETFYGCSGLTNFIVPNSVTNIRYGAFSKCGGLTNIVIGSGVKSCDSQAFVGCTNIISMTIPQLMCSVGLINYSPLHKSVAEVTIADGVSKIGANAFSKCSSLRCVRIPATVVDIDSRAFSGTSGHVSFVVDEANPSYKSVLGFLLSKDGKTLIFGPSGEVTIPDGVTTIANYAFSSAGGLTDVVIPNSVTSIGRYAFSGCNELTGITLLGDVFSGVSYLPWKSLGRVRYSLTYANNWRPYVEQYGIRDAMPIEFADHEIFMEEVGGNTWYYYISADGSTIFSGEWGHSVVGVTGGDELIIPNCLGGRPVVEIGFAAFAESDCCGRIVIPPSVTNIADYAFYSCSKLENISIPSSVSAIGNYAFACCSQLEHVKFNEPSALRRIGDSAFRACVGIDVSSFNLPGSIVEIGHQALLFKLPKLLGGTLRGENVLDPTEIYLVSNNVTLARGAVLTVPAGTIVKFNSGVSLTVNSGATLNAIGTRAQPIVFTSIKDDEFGGDTNGDGDKTYPWAGDWARIYAGGTLNMNYCRVRYCNNNSDQGAIHGSGGTVMFDNGIIEASTYECVRMNSGMFISHNSVFRDASMGFGYYGGSGVYVYNGVIADCTIACRASNKHFYNTVFYNCYTFLESTSSSCDHCVFYNEPGLGAQSATQVGSNGNIWGNPLFVDVENGDFRIQKGSPCINAGDAANAPEYDYYGQPRDDGAPDIGIYEMTSGLSVNDLAAVEVNAQAARSTIGETLTISYGVANVGKQAIDGSWRDKVSLVSADGGYSLDLGTVVSGGAIAVGATNTFNASFTVPPEAEGTWRVQVGVNVERDVYEGTNVMNNVATSTGTVEISMPARAAADGFVGTAKKGAPASAKFALDGTEPMVARINAPAGTVVYLGSGVMPSASSYSARAVVGADGGLIGIPAGVTTAYLLVETTSSSGAAFSMTLESAALAVQSVSPATLPYTGTTGLVIDGANFAEGCTVVVERAASAFGTGEPPVLLSSVVSPTRMTAQIDCSRLTAGATYDVKVIGADEATAVLPNAVTVAKVPAAPKLKATLDAPASVRRGRTLTVYIDYENVGNADMPAPVFELISQGQVFKIDGAVYTNSVKAMGLSAEAPVGTLRPGEPQRLAIPVTILAENVKWKLRSYHAAQEGAKNTRLSLTEFYNPEWVLYSVSNHPDIIKSARKILGSTYAEFYENLCGWVSELDIGIIDYTAVSRSFANYAYCQGQIESRASEANEQIGASALLGAKVTKAATLRAEPLSDIQGSVYKRVDGEWKLAVSQNAEVLQRLSSGKKTYIICHGNDNDINEEWVGKMADAIPASEKGAGANVLAINWGECATIWGGADVFSSAYFIPYVALIARTQLEILGIDPSSTTFIGHSHGGHLAGRIITSWKSGDQFERMVGLDTSVEFVHENVDWINAIRSRCRQVEFYKSSWTFSMIDNIYGHYNFAVVGDNDFMDVLDVTIVQAIFKKDKRLDATKKLLAAEGLGYVKGKVFDIEKLLSAIGLAKFAGKLSNVLTAAITGYKLGGQAAGFQHEKWRHGEACNWFTRTIENDSLYKNIGFNFDGSSSWKVLCGGDDIPSPGHGKLAGVINNNKVELLSNIRSGKTPWRYRETVLNQSDTRFLGTFRSAWGDKLNPMRTLRNAVAETFEYDISGVTLAESIASKTKFSFTTRDNADNTSIPFGELEGQLELGFPDRTEATMWLVDLDGLAEELHTNFDKGRTWNYSTLTNYLSNVDQTRHVRAVGSNINLLSSIEKPNMIIPKFMNDVFDSERPLFANGISNHRRTLLVLGVGTSYDERRITFPEHDLYPDNNFAIREVLALPGNLFAVISKAANRSKASSLRSAQLFAAAPTHQLSANALKPGEVVSVTADKNGNWSISLDCTESYTTAEDDEIVYNRFELLDAGSDDGAPHFQNNNTICDVECVTVSGTLPTATDADGNPVCEGKRYTVQLTVASGDNEDDVTTCVLDVRATKDEDTGEEEDDDSSNEPKSCDPNEMVGDEGVGEARLVKPGQELTYTIYFENKSDADAAAACVEVFNPLSDALDWSSLVMLDVGYNGNVDNGLSGLHEGLSEKTLEGTNTSVKTEFAVVYYDEEGNVLDENALAARSTMEGVSARAEWYLRIIDPNGDSEGWPLDMTGGFLPPNDPETHCGEGYIRYKVKVRDDAPANTIITNSATIIFDHFNDPIETDPAWWNTVGSLGAQFIAFEVEVNEGGNAEIRVSGGNADVASSVKVYLTYNTAAAADVDLSKGTVRRVGDNAPCQSGLKFPLALSWEAGEIGEKVITIPTKTDKMVEDDEFFTLQLAEPVGMELGESSVCAVTIHDPGYDDLAAKVAAGTATKAELSAWDKLQKAKAPYVRGLADPANAGKVTGSGLCAEGKKVTLKATANKGFVFMGWRRGTAVAEAMAVESGNGFVAKTASLVIDRTAKPAKDTATSTTITGITEDATYYADFITVEEDKAAVALTVDGVELRRVEDNAPYQKNVCAGVYLEWPVAADALSQTTVKVAGLPAGLKFADKPVTAKVGTGKSAVTVTNVPANTIYGAPTAASAIDKKTGLPKPSDVKITVTTAGKSSVTYLVKLTVDPLPTWVVGTFDGEVEGGGIVQAFTVATSGKISGKILEGGKTWTLSAGEFSRVEQAEKGDVFYATVVGKAGKEVVTNEVAVRRDGDIAPYQGVVSGVMVGEPSLSWAAWQNLWKRTDTKAAQPVFKKSIVVEYGDPGDKDNMVKITFKTGGVVSFSGKVEGVSVSGSTQLVCGDNGWQVTLYAPPKKGFDGWCETFDVEMTLDGQNVVAVALNAVGTAEVVE